MVAAARFCSTHRLAFEDGDRLLEYVRKDHRDSVENMFGSEQVGLLQDIRDPSDGVAFCRERVLPCEEEGGANGTNCNEFSRYLLHFLSTRRGTRDPPVIEPEDRNTGGGAWALVTSSDARYFDKMRNLIGSIMFWEPNTIISLFDLGLSSEQRERASRWKNVRLHDFDYNKYPPHVRTLTNFAWKPLVMNESLAVYEHIFYLDTSVELRSPINEIKSKIFENGYFFVHQVCVDIS